MEREYKWQCLGPRDFDKFKTALNSAGGFRKKLSHVFIFDSYFDDAQNTLRAQKTALRLRSLDGKYEITVKSQTQVKDGLAQRAEETLPLKASSHTRALAALKAAFRTLWPDLKGPKQLFSIKNKRRVILLESAELSAEICFDDCLIITPAKTIKFYEIEMEFKKGSFSAFTALAKTLTEKSGLKYAQLSKVATATALLEGKL